MVLEDAAVIVGRGSGGSSRRRIRSRSCSSNPRPPPPPPTPPAPSPPPNPSQAKPKISTETLFEGPHGKNKALGPHGKQTPKRKIPRHSMVSIQPMCITELVSSVGAIPNLTENNRARKSEESGSRKTHPQKKNSRHSS